MSSTPTIHLLGDPPTTYADKLEAPVFEVEKNPHSSTWTRLPLMEAFTVKAGANDQVPTAEIRLNIAGGENAFALAPVRDWQVHDEIDVTHNAWDFLLGGRRIRIRTNRGNSLADWCIFEGFVDKIELGWSGSNRRTPRWANVFATSTLIAADRELSQQLIGQWRRDRVAEIALTTLAPEPGEPPLEGAQDTMNGCVRCAVPLIFNPGGRPNCHPKPLEFADGTKVYIPTDPDAPGALPWTVIKVLRYVQWAAVQPELFIPDSTSNPKRYQQGAESRVEGIKALYGVTSGEGQPSTQSKWTSFGLRHQNLEALCVSYGSAGAPGFTKLIDRPPAVAAAGEPEAALLAAPRDLAVEGFSVLEAFAYISERAGILMDSFQEFAAGGGVATKLRFSVRGGRRPATDEVDSPVSGSSGFWARGVYLYVQTDGAARADEQPKAALRANLATEGSLLLDDSGRVEGVLEYGAAAEHELTVTLRPGWRPDAWWDINPDSPSALDEATIRAATSVAWASRYVTSLASPANRALYQQVGRYWVLNEDGAFAPDTFTRDFGPWASEVGWRPYNFSGETLDIGDLQGRGSGESGGGGWCARRRRFLVPEATLARTLAAPDEQRTANATADRLGIVVEMSFDAGTTWNTRLADILNDATRCAITISTPDLRTIRAPNGATDFVTAYLSGTLRVRVTAAVAGDDVVYGAAHRNIGAALGVQWWTARDRHGSIARKLREATPSALVAYGLKQPPSRDDTAAADASAARALDHLVGRRVAGSVVLPYLMRPSDAVAWPNYRIGDEVLGIRTGAADTMLNFESSSGAGGRAPRIVALAWSYPQCSTALTLEEEIYDPSGGASLE